MTDYQIPLEADQYYHIYNRGNNKDCIFFTKANYDYFLIKYDEYLSDFVETYAYCLLPNHFHLLVRVKDAEVVSRLSRFSKLGKPLSEPSEVISEAFRRFFTSYSKSINVQESRTGSLFQKNFKRKLIHDESYFTTCIAYIHQNPEKHGLCKDFRLYEFSSYRRILNEKPSKLKKKEVLEWFYGAEAYIKFHDLTIKSSEFEIEN